MPPSKDKRGLRLAPVYMTVDEVADYLGLQPDTVYKYKAKGILHPSKSRAGTLRWRLEDIIEFQEWNS